MGQMLGHLTKGLGLLGRWAWQVTRLTRNGTVAVASRIGNAALGTYRHIKGTSEGKAIGKAILKGVEAAVKGALAYIGAKITSWVKKWSEAKFSSKPTVAYGLAA